MPKSSRITNSIRSAIFVLIALMATGCLFGQQDSTDTTAELSNVIRQMLDKDAIRTKSEYQERVILNRQRELFGVLRKLYSEAGEYVRNGVDTAKIEASLDDIEQKYTVAGDGIFTEKGTIQTARNLATSAILYYELLAKTELLRNNIGKEYAQVIGWRNKIDSLSLDPSVFYVPKDSVGASEFLQKVILLAAEHAGTDKLISAELKKLGVLNDKVALQEIALRARISEIEGYREQLSENTLKREIAPIWDSVGYVRNFSEILHFSWMKTSFVAEYYISNHIGYLLLLAVLIAGFSYFVRLVYQRANQEDISNSTIAVMVSRHPVVAGTFIALMLWQFMLPKPPFVIFGVIWVIGAVLLAILLRGFISAFWFRFWLLQTLLLSIGCWMNTVLQASRVERYLMVALAVAGILLSVVALQKKYRSLLMEKKLSVLLVLYLILLVLAIVTNAVGMFNFGKAILTSAVLGLSVGVMMLWSVRFISITLQQSALVFQQGDQVTYFNFRKLSQDAPGALYLLAGIGWLVLMTRSFYIYKKLTNPILEAFTTTYKIGNSSFSLGNVVLFVAILAMAAIVSRIVSFVVGQPPAKSDNKDNRQKGIGSWLLLIRIGIILSGLLLAFAATGIPVDRLTIIFGGLSVGIGFGLQAIFESLISGIILAFEKPINVGDEVLIAGQAGIMKSIGFRSSVISTFAGADVTIPNNELLKSQLINWTLTNTNRRVDVVVGVDYSTDLRKVCGKLEDLMLMDDRILKTPPPNVLVKEFAASSIDLRLSFWVNHLNPWPQVQSELLKDIKEMFDAEGVSIPFPQVVVHQPDADTPGEQDTSVDAKKDPAT